MFFIALEMMKITCQETKNTLVIILNHSGIIFQSKNDISSRSRILSRFQAFLRKTCSVRSMFATRSYMTNKMDVYKTLQAKPWPAFQSFYFIFFANERYGWSVLHQNNEFLQPCFKNIETTDIPITCTY